MEGTISGRSMLACTLLFLSLEVCLAELTVNVATMVDVIKGQSARLPCSYTAPEETTITVVEWYIENSGSGRQRVAFRSSTDSGHDSNTPMTGRVRMDTDMTLVISNVETTDERSFYCSVNGGAAGSSEAKTMLKVFYAPETPTVSGNNQPVSISGGRPSEVGTCTSRNGHPEPRIIWFKDSAPLPEVKDSKEKMYMVPRMVKESSNLFTVTSTLYMLLKKEDAKSVFHCTVEYAMPNKQIKQESSSNFTLSLLYPAENVYFTVLNEKRFKEGDDVQLKCTTDGNPQPEFEFEPKKENIVKDGSGLLTLKKAKRGDSGTYECTALDFDSPVDLIASLTIRIDYLDMDVVPTGPVHVNKEESVDLQCKPTSSEAFTLQWMKDDKVLTSKGALSLTAVTLADAGVYVCAASVPSVPGLQNKTHVEVIVSGSPEIDEPMKGEVDKEGDMVTLKCSAKGYPAPQFTWKPAGKVSVNVDGNSIISTVMLKATADILSSGVTCEVNNSYGTDSKKIPVALKSGNNVESGAGRESAVFATAHAQQGGSSGVVIAVVVCVLLLLLLVATLYFLSKKGKVACGKKDRKDMESGENNKDSLMNKSVDNDGAADRLTKSGD